MAKEPIRIAQPTPRAEGASRPQQAGAAEDARRAAIVAFTVTADTEMGDYDENPTILFRSGPLPHPIGSRTRPAPALSRRLRRMSGD